MRSLGEGSCEDKRTDLKIACKGSRVAGKLHGASGGGSSSNS